MREERKTIWLNVFQTKLLIRIAVYGSIYMITLMNLLFVWRLLLEGPGDLLEQYGRFLADFYPALILFALLFPAVAWDALKFSIASWGPWFVSAGRSRTWLPVARCNRSNCAKETS